MAVLESTVNVDVHFTTDVDADAVRSVMRNDTRGLDSTLEQSLVNVLHEAVENRLEEVGVTDAEVEVGLDLVDERVPGAPRERASGTIRFEADDTTAADIDTAFDPPTRGAMADDASDLVRSFLRNKGIEGDLDVTVSLTPASF